jgi:hypothetical protein
MAGLSKFVVADLTGPRVPGELQAIVDKFKKPIIAIGESGLPSTAAHNSSVLVIENDSLLECKLVEMERLHAHRIADLAREKYEKIVRMH